MTPELPLEPETTLQPAGFVTRLIAFLIDQCIIGVILGLLTAVSGILFQSFRLGQLLGTDDLTLQLALIPLGAAGFILGLLYYVGFWLLTGQTPGKAVLGVALVRVDGRPLRPGAAIVRWLGYWLSGILFLGYLWILIDNRRQAWHDKLAGTLVVFQASDVRHPIRTRLRSRAIARSAEKDAGSLPQ
jgi:uncharacterized RDD family membrane protein YckC